MAYDSKWWSMRSGDLIGSNTITQDISDAILKFFGKKDGKAGDIFMVILGMVALGFLIGGYTLIMTKYMPESKGVRIIMNILPMAVGFYLFYRAFFNKFDSKVYMEVAASLCIFLTGYSLSFLSMDLGFLGGTKFMVYWMLFSIPVIYLATSTVGAYMYLLILFIWLGGAAIFGALEAMMNPMRMVMGGSNPMEMFAGMSFHPGENIFGWFFILLILPHFMRYTDRPSFDTRKLFLGWVGGCILMHCAMNSFTSYGAIAGPFLMICFYMAGKEYFADGKFWWNRPFQTLTVLAVVLGSWSMNVPQSHGGFLYSSGLAEGTTISNNWFTFIINLAVVLGVIAWACYSVYNDYKGEKKANLLLVAYPAVLVLVLLIDKSSESSGDFKAGAWLFSLYTLALGADYIMKGLKSKEYQLAALGTVIALPILIYRILDVLKDAFTAENWQMLGGLIAFAIGGLLLFIGTTLYASTHKTEE